MTAPGASILLSCYGPFDLSGDGFAPLSPATVCRGDDLRDVVHAPGNPSLCSLVRIILTLSLLMLSISSDTVTSIARLASERVKPAGSFQ